MSTAQKRFPQDHVLLHAVIAGNLVPLGYQQITSVASSTALTVPTNARIALILVETAAVRWRDDGTAPTASVGMPISAAGQLVYDGDLAAIRFIQQSAGAVLNVAYYT